MTRREFLERLAGLSAAGLVGAACARQTLPSGPTASPSPTPAVSPSPSPTTQPPTPSPSPQATATSTPPRVRAALVRGPQVGAMVARAVELAGGLAGLKPGALVLIKPNVNSDDPHPATTSPAVVRAVVEAVKGYNPRRIVVADRSNARYDTLRAMQRLGIYEEARSAGAEVVALDREEWVAARPQGATSWQSLEAPRLLLEADYVISVPVAHTHFLAGFSLALKNWVGMIHPRNRDVLHSTGPGYSPSISASPPPRVTQHYGVRIAEANLPRPADFVVLDATRAFLSGGPFAGEAASPGLVLACRDLVAADAAGLALLRHLGAWAAVSGVPVWQQPQIARAVELGLGVRGPQNMELVGEGVPELEAIKGLLSQNP